MSSPASCLRWLLLSTTVAATASANPPSVCVRRSMPVAGLDAESLQLAHRIESRADPRSVALIDDGTSCDPAPAILELDVDVARVLIGGASEASLPLRALVESERATAVIRLLRDTFASEPVVPVIEDDLPTMRTLRSSQATELSSAISHLGRLRGYVALSGDWNWESDAGLHTGEIHLDGGLALLGDALLVGIRLGFQPPTAFELTRVTTTTSAAPLTATVRGGWRLGPVDLTLGAGIGVEWRFVDVAPTNQSIRRSDTVTSSFIEGELEVSATFVDWLRVGAFGGARRFLTWTDVAWDGELAYATPRLSTLAGLRVTAFFGGGVP